MRLSRILSLTILLLGLVTKAQAGCSTGALPFQLQNNTTADATQVMANFNQIVNGAQSNCAAAGANNDITSLGALSTPISPAQGGTLVFNGGSSSGTNALTIATTPAFTLTTGFRVSFFASATNTAATTVNVSSTGIKNLFRKTQLGSVTTAGGELLNGLPYQIIYDGTEFVLDTETIIIGEMKTFAGGTVPAGWLLADSSTYNQATYPGLFSVIGQTYGGSTGTFQVPDSRGRVMTGLDNYGSGAGAAGRLTNASTGCGTVFNSLGVTCANAGQSHTQIVAELATHTPTFTDPGHTHGLNNVLNPNSGGTLAGGNALITAVTVTSSATTGITMNPIGSSQPMPIVPNNLGMLMIIRY